jgi:plasmid maintenance system killer protein
MIQSFADETAVTLLRERDTRHARRLPGDLWRVARRKLKALDVAGRLDDRRIVAGNRLQRLKAGDPDSTACASTISIA